MKINSFFIFIVFCVGAVTSNPAHSMKDTQSNNKNLWLNRLKFADGKTKMIDLNDIQDQIDITVLDRMHSADNFKKKIANKVVFIQQNVDGTYSICLDGKVGYDIEINLVYVLLEHFGEYISKLVISMPNPKSEGHLKKMVEIASQYCENLLKIFITGGKNIFDVVKKPFYNVTSVELQFSEFETHSQNFKEIFPNIQRLELLWFKIKDDIFNDHFPKLDYLVIGMEDRFIGKLIEKNPQIRFLKMGFVSANLVKLASEHLPILETLQLPYDTKINYEGEIHFKNVKHFEINKITGGLLNITFEQLEELKCNSYFFSQWIDTVETNPNLKKLTVKTRDGVDDEYISLLIKIARNLVEASFDCACHTQAETIVKFLKESKHMQKLYLNYCYSILNELKLQIPDNWNLMLLEHEVIFIERK
ncbi:uncharacterized protein LOC116336961 [Contarinia nasturtii]|uniref:uncharacterized protein LOC116336961 n=1 Tax=Contarinia nasturtii TaxID=265458 RepID=UPI0012D3DCBC|nr:uncharacterized protein LOC116336961 [Contarinia nasturtii]